MDLNINKCSVLSITLKCNSILHSHGILGTTLRRVTNHDYLGVAIGIVVRMSVSGYRG